MTRVQKLQIERGEVAAAINTQLDVEERSEAQDNELESLKGRCTRLDTVDIPAAMLAAGDAEAEARAMFGNGDGEAGERGRLLRETRMADYLAPAIAGTGLTGRPAELNAALEAPIAGTGGGVMVPFDVLAGTELRQVPANPERRAFTTTGNNDGSEMQRPVLQRLFGPGILDSLGVRLDTVPTGRAEWPLLASGVALRHRRKKETRRRRRWRQRSRSRI